MIEQGWPPVIKIEPPRDWPQPPKAKEQHMEPQLGTNAKDKITGFVGRVIGRCEYLTGCTQFLLVPPVKADGDLIGGSWFDVDRIQVIDATPIDLTVTKNGADIPAPIK